MNIATLARSLGITCPTVQPKAEELLRLCRVRCPQGIQGQQCVPAACLDLACQIRKITFPRARAITTCAVNKARYEKTLSLVQNVLKLQPTLSVHALAVKFGCLSLVKDVEGSLDLFKRRYLEAQSVHCRSRVDFTKPIFTGVAFYVTARYKGVRVEKQQVIELCSCPTSDFQRLCNTMVTMCELTKSKKKTNSKSKGTEEDELSDLEGVEIDEEYLQLVGDLKKSKKRKRQEQYAEFKKNVLAKQNNEGEDAPPPRKKQAVLSFCTVPRADKEETPPVHAVTKDQGVL